MSLSKKNFIEILILKLNSIILLFLLEKILATWFEWKKNYPKKKFLKLIWLGKARKILARLVSRLLKWPKSSARIGFYLKLLWFSLPKISLIFLTENLFDFSYLKFLFSRRMLKNKKSFIRMRCFKSFINFCFGEQQQQKKWKDLIHFLFVSSIAYLLFW